MPTASPSSRPSSLRLGFFVVCIEFTGHGKSDHANTSTSNHFVYALDVIDVADSLGATSFHLLGHSMGAIVSGLVSGAVPNRVLSLIMIDAIGAVGSKRDEDAPEILERALLQRSSIVNRRPRVYDSIEECVTRWSESAFAPRGRENVALIVQRGTEEIYDPANGVRGFRFRHDPRLVSLPVYVMTQRQSLAFLARVQCPSLVFIANDREPFWADRDFKMNMEALRASVVYMEGGHHLHLSNAKLVADHVLKFYQDSGVLCIKSRL